MTAYRDNPATRRAIVELRQVNFEPEPEQIPLVRLANIFLSAVLLWIAVIGWVLSMVFA